MNVTFLSDILVSFSDWSNLYSRDKLTCSILLSLPQVKNLSKPRYFTFVLSFHHSCMELIRDHDCCLIYLGTRVAMVYQDLCDIEEKYFYFNKILLLTFRLSEKSKHECQTVRRTFIQSKVGFSMPQKNSLIRERI